MSNSPLLPSGLPDRVGKEALQAFHASATLLAHFLESGFQLVSPPLIEGADTVQNFGSDALLQKSFRLLDPASGETMAVRADMTPQIARIVSSTLKEEPRPLKLAYSGNVLRTEPDGLRTRRQYQQVGIELFGAKAGAEATILSVLAEGLQKLDIESLQLDIALPGLLKTLLDDLDATKKATALELLRIQDMQKLHSEGLSGLAQLLSCSGEAKAARKQLNAYSDDSHKPMLSAVDQLITAADTHSNIVHSSIDALDTSYGSYFTSVAFALFDKESMTEIGRGGRYVTPNGEEAVGFTFYMEDILPLLSTQTKQDAS